MHRLPRWPDAMDAQTPIKPKLRNPRGALILLLAALGACTGPTTAWGAERSTAGKSLVPQPHTTAEKAAGIARREIGGRVLSVTALKGGQRGYRIRLLLNGGRITTVLVDPRGGIRKSS